VHIVGGVLLLLKWIIMMISSHLLKNVSLTTLKQTTGFFSSKALYTNQKVATNLGLIPKPNFTSNKTRTELTRKNPIFTFSDHICKRSFHQSSTLNDDPTHFDKATYAALNGIPEEAVRRKAKIWREDRRPSQQGSGKTGLWTVNFIPDKITVLSSSLHVKKFSHLILLDRSNPIDGLDWR
jgi:hypothetical protein